MLRAVFDTVIFVRCLINPKSFWGRLVFEHGTSYRLALSEPILAEILEVIQRPEIREKFRSYAGLGMREILEILANAEVVEVDEIAEVCRDPGDDKFLATAVAANAGYLVSEDADLLDIGTFEGVKIVTAATFLQIVSTAAA